MAIIGHAAASMNVFLDILILLRGVGQSMFLMDGPHIQLSLEFFDLIERVDPKDPTRIFDEYYGDWWNFEKDWKTHSVEVDYHEAFLWHLTKVSEKFAFSLRS